MSSITEHCLAPSLRERLRAGQGERLPAPRAGHAHVLYLLRTAFRADNNPSLEIALRMASSLGLPLVCLAVIEDGTPRDRMWPPTDRAAAFRLEALRELQPLFAARGTALYVHVERDGHRQAVAMSLSAKAALVVCDEHFGIEPHATAAARAAQACGGALWLCDTACTVASTTLTASALVGGNGGFLRATAAARAMRLGSDGSWFPPPAPAPPQPPPAQPPGWSIDLQPDGALDAVLAAPSRRDGSVGRLRHTRGGPKAAAARWATYVRGGGLRSYASHRNNPVSPDGKGASRMSAYVNAGMIDPFAMARDAKAAGADKFLSEFVGFRESAHLWCLLHPGGYADALTAVPTWARGQLRGAAEAARSDGGRADACAPTIQALEEGQTGDVYWDDCQRCLNLSGELHNNVRMAWGKAVVQWHASGLRSAATEAGVLLRRNRERVLHDICNPSRELNIDGTKPLTQLELTRVPPELKALADGAYLEIERRLLGEGRSAPKGDEERKVWYMVASYLEGRIQGAPSQRPGRKPDMDPPAAEAARAVLKLMREETSVDQVVPTQGESSSSSGNVGGSAPSAATATTRANSAAALGPEAGLQAARGPPERSTRKAACVAVSISAR